ncbi:MAG: type II secretion system protein [Verrucomicrobiota bacterium]
MTSAASKPSKARQGGFSLLEIVIVLSIAAMVVGGALTALYFNRDEAKLNDATSGVELLAKRARTISTLQQRPYALVFENQSVQLMPFAEAMVDPRDLEELLDEQDARLRERQAEIEFSGEDGGVPLSEPSVRDGWTAEEDMEMFVRRWGTNDWLPVSRRDRHIWRFDPDGICEPFGVRCEMAESWVQVVFHPLTAAINETESEIR